MKNLITKRAAHLAIVALLFSSFAFTLVKTQHHPFVINLLTQLKLHSQQVQSEKVYVQLDRNFYQPGEHIWFKAYIRNANGLTQTDISDIVYVELINPKGSVIGRQKLMATNGLGSGVFPISEDVGGIYKIKAYTSWQKNSQTTFVRDVQVQKVVLPNLNMKLDFERKAYGAGDQAIANLSLESLDKLPLRYAKYEFIVQVEGKEVLRRKESADFDGKASIQFKLPKKLNSNDALLQVIIPHKGVAESISRSIPIVLNDIDLQFFPEGGDLIAGLKTKLAFKALNEFGKPADIEGAIYNASGEELYAFKSFHQGMGNLNFYPDRNVKYYAKITKPEGIAKKYYIPIVKPRGYNLHVLSQDDEQIKVSIQSTRYTELHLVAQNNDFIPFSKTFMIDKETTISIPIKDFPMGISKLTLFDSKGQAHCERLVFVNPNKHLNISVKTDKEKYAPREKVVMDINISDQEGHPVAGNFSLSVADSKLLTFADDKQGHIFAKIFLESELKGKIEEPDFYFKKDEAKAIVGLDLLMQTHGWRRFDWKEIQKEEPIAYTFKKEEAFIGGKIVDECGEPIVNARISAIGHDSHTTSNEFGDFKLKGFPFAHIGNRIKIESTGRASIIKSVSEYKQDFFIIQPEGYGTISGKILLPNRTKASAAYATLFDDEGQRWTGRVFQKQNEYAFNNIPAGEYTLRLNHPGYRSHQVERVRVWAGTNINISRKLKSSTDPTEIYVSQFNKEMEQSNNEWLSAKNDLKAASKQNTPPVHELVFQKSRIAVRGGGVSLDEIIITEFKVPLIQQDNTTQGGIKTAEEIAKLPTKNIGALASSVAGMSQLDEGDAINVRGSRSNATDVYVDGIRVNANAIQSTDIEQIAVLTGGIPAMYGGGLSLDLRAKKRYNPQSKFDGKRNTNLMGYLDYDGDDQGYGLGLGDGGFQNTGEGANNFVGNNYRYSKHKKYKKTPKNIYRLVDQRPQLKSKECEKIMDPDECQACSDNKLMERIETAIEKAYKHGKMYSGNAVIHFYVDRNGQSGDVNIHFETSGYNYYVRNSITSAINDIKSKKWRPAKLNGRSVASWYSIPIEFGYPGKYQQSNYTPTRTFYAPKYETKQVVDQRSDFRSTIYWNPNITTDEDGTAKLEFWNSDDLTTFTTTIEGFSNSGLVGATEHKYYTQMPFSLSAKAPTSFLVGDEVRLPIILTNNTEETIEGQLNIIVPSCFKQLKEVDSQYILLAGESRSVYPTYEVTPDCTKDKFEDKIEVSFKSSGFGDAFTKKITIQSSGYPIYEMFTGGDTLNVFDLDIKAPRKGSINMRLDAHPSVLSEVMSSLERMLRQPGGCFEQTSSSNYPNIMVMQYMKNHPNNFNTKIQSKAKSYLESGYKRLIGYEVKGGGFEWFGHPPAHEALTAYGLLEFTDMKSVYPVDKKMLDRTAKWLLGRKDENGSWKISNAGLHSWLGTSEIRDAYIVWALCEAGYASKIGLEIEKSYSDALTTEDPYIMGLVCNALFKAKDKRAESLLEILLKTQEKDGSFIGKTASVTRSKGKNLILETTALVSLAMMKSNHVSLFELERAITTIAKSKTQYGFGSTQATVLSLKALIEYEDFKSKDVLQGKIELLVDGKVIDQSVQFNTKQSNSIALSDLGKFVSEGKHTVEVRFVNSKKAIPFELQLSYHSKLPQVQESDCKVTLKTDLKRGEVQHGETLRLTTALSNNTEKGQASPIAIIGIPSGLSPQPWQLKDIQEKKLIDYYEIIDDKIVFYFNGLEANETRTIHLDLKADIPGNFESPASCAYLYYENDVVNWVNPSSVRVMTN